MAQVQAGSASQVLNLLFSGNLANAENTFKIKAQAIGIDKEGFSEQLQLAVSQLLQGEEFGEGGLDFDDEFLGQAERFVDQGGKIFPAIGEGDVDLSQLDLSKIDLSKLEQLAEALSKLEELKKWGADNGLSENEQQKLIASFIDENMGSLKQYLADLKDLDQLGIDERLLKPTSLSDLKDQITNILAQIKAATDLNKQRQQETGSLSVQGRVGTEGNKLISDPLLVDQITQLEQSSKSSGRAADTGILGSLAKIENLHLVNGADRNLAKLEGELSKDELAKLTAKDLPSDDVLLDEKGKRLEVVQFADKKLLSDKEKLSDKFSKNLSDSQFLVRDKTVAVENHKISNLFSNAASESIVANGAKTHLNPASHSFASTLAGFNPAVHNEQAAQGIHSVNAKLEPSSEFTQGLNLKQNFAPNLGMRIQWMFRQSLSSAEILMDPPEMGPLSVKVNHSNGETNILFQVTNLATKEALEDNLAKLKEMLDQQGINLGEAQVQHKDSQLAEKENGESEDPADEMIEEDSGQAENVAIRSEHIVDLYS